MYQEFMCWKNTNIASLLWNVRIFTYIHQNGIVFNVRFLFRENPVNCKIQKTMPVISEPNLFHHPKHLLNREQESGEQFCASSQARLCCDWEFSFCCISIAILRERGLVKGGKVYGMTPKVILFIQKSELWYPLQLKNIFFKLPSHFIPWTLGAQVQMFFK